MLPDSACRRFSSSISTTDSLDAMSSFEINIIKVEYDEDTEVFSTERLLS